MAKSHVILDHDKYWFIKAETTRSLPAPLCARMSGKEWARDRLANIAKIPLIIVKKKPWLEFTSFYAVSCESFPPIRQSRLMIVSTNDGKF